MDDSLEARVHHNLIEINTLMATRVERRAGGVLFALRSEMPFLNGALREASDTSAEALISHAKDFFFGLGRGFVVFTWPRDPALTSAAEQAGLFPVLERYPEMVCRR